MHLIGGNGLVIILHEELQQALSGVAFGEIRSYSNAFVGILDAVRVGSQFGEAGSPVAVQLVSLWVDRRGATFQGLCIELDCLWVLLLPEGLRSSMK